MKKSKAAEKAKPAKKPSKSGKTRAKAAPKAAKRAPLRIPPLDLSKFPPESIGRAERWVCLACIWEVFTRHMGLAPKTALAEIKRYTPTLEELQAAVLARPFFLEPSRGSCPYCGSPAKWLARLSIHRIESGKATDALRRELVKKLPKTGHQFVVLEEKATQQHAFFGWLEKISEQLDLEDPAWLHEVSRHYLSRKEPKVDWLEHFEQVHSVRRSRRLEDGWEVDNQRLFLAPLLFDELLLVQYLVSRSHVAGGLTFEGRYTLPELFARLRNAGYLRAVGVSAGNPSDALENLLVHLSGGEAALRYYYIVDRRELLETSKLLEKARAK